MFRAAVLVAAFVVVPTSAAHAGRLLIDDFSIDQQGIETDQTAAFDLLEDPRLFGGGREIWGAGTVADGNCENGTMAVRVDDGAFQILNSPDCHGRGAVTWPARITTAAIDLSPYPELQIEVEEVIGDVLTRISVASNTSATARFDITLSESGLHVFRFPSEADLASVNHITIASLLDPGEALALGSVWVAIPEPTAIEVSTICMAIALALRRYRYFSFTWFRNKEVDHATPTVFLE